MSDSYTSIYKFCQTKLSWQKINRKIQQQIKIVTDFLSLLTINLLRNIVLLSRSDLNSSQQFNINWFGAEEQVKLIDLEAAAKASEGHQAAARRDRQLFKQLNNEKPFIVTIKKAKLIGEHGLVIDRENNLYLESLLQKLSYPKQHQNILAIGNYLPVEDLLQDTLSKTERPAIAGTYCSLLHQYSGNYYHWMQDCLSRLPAVEFYQQLTGIIPILIVPAKLKSWQANSLQLMGYDRDRYLPWQAKNRSVENLILPSCRHYKFQSPDTYRWIKKRILSNIQLRQMGCSFASKVFISRRNAKNRRILNEERVLEALQPLGFQPYELETMSFQEQVKLFAEAEIVIAPHGAGLTNIVYAKDLTVIELFGNHLASCYADMSTALGYRYQCLVCKSTRYPYIPSKHQDMIVDIDRLICSIKSNL